MLLSRIFPINFVVYQNHLSCLVVPLSSFEFLEEEKNRLAFDPFYSSELNPRTPRFDIFSLTINGWVTTFFFFVRFHRLKWGTCNLICTADFEIIFEFSVHTFSKIICVCFCLCLVLKFECALSLQEVISLVLLVWNMEKIGVYLNDMTT